MSNPDAITANEPTWTGSPSQVVNALRFVACIVGFLAISFVTAHALPWVRAHHAVRFFQYVLFVAEMIPVVLIARYWLRTNAIRYELTQEQLTVKRGVLNQEVDTLELYRVRDYTVDRPLLLRMCGLGNLVMPTSDRSNPTVILEAVPNVLALRETLRQYVEECRVQKGVREIDDVR